MDLTYLKRDMWHYFVNATLTLLVLVFYWKYGFYGWHHLISVIAIQYSVLPLDGWLEKARPFPYYVVPMLAFAAYHYPLITALALAGDVVVNLRSILKRNSFILEKIESIGNIPIYVMPFTFPIGLNDMSLYLAAFLFLLFMDSFHKIGHKESSNARMAWITGLAFFFAAIFLYATPTPLFVAFASLCLISIIPFKLLEKRKQAWAYSQLWFGFAGFIAFYYYLAFFT